MPRGSHLNAPAEQRGFTFVWVLAAVTLLSIGLSGIGQSWAEQGRREREQELLRVGQLYAEAIARFRALSPGGAGAWPRSLDELVFDPRFARIERHLRRLYDDPTAPGQPWGLVTAPDGGIKGVYSRSTAQPLRRGPVRIGKVNLPAATRYDQWHFIIESSS